MEAVFLLLALVLVCFSVVLIFGAPYVPAHKKQIDLSLDLLDLKKGQWMYELGCGDGRVLKAAARKGYRAVGYEMNPILFAVAKLVTWKYRKNVKVQFGNFWNVDLSPADGVYVFLLDRFMKRLDNKLSKELSPGTKLASYAFKIPNKKAYAIESGIFIYQY